MNNLKLDLKGVKQITNLFALALKERLEKNGSNASGMLSNSIKGKVKYDGKYVSVYVDLEDYWKYVENGTKPHFPPVDAIKQWIKVKPVLPRPLKDGKLPTENQLAFLIGRKISKVGTKANPFLAPTISDFELVDKIYTEVDRVVTEALNSAIEEELK